MALFSFFKTPRHQQFKYVPRYYDPQKEKLDQILGQYKEGDQKSAADLAKSRISSTFKSRNPKSEIVGRSRRNSNYLLLAIIAILLVLSYVLLTVHIPRFIHFMEG